MTAKTRYFTVCHNDDSPSDPDHRRVRLEVYKDAGRWWLTFPDDGASPDTDLGATLAEAMAALDSVYPAGGFWDRRAA